jgi:hypothetical protein
MHPAGQSSESFASSSWPALLLKSGLINSSMVFSWYLFWIAQSDAAL